MHTFVVIELQVPTLRFSSIGKPGAGAFYIDIFVSERSGMAQAYVIGRVTEDLEFKVSTNHHPYVRFTVAETIGSGRQVRTQYLQICAFGTVVERLKRAHVKRGSLIWVSGSLELEVFCRQDGTPDKRLKVLLDNWGFVPAFQRATQGSQTQMDSSSTATSVIDGDRETLPD